MLPVFVSSTRRLCQVRFTFFPSEEILKMCKPCPGRLGPNEKNPLIVRAHSDKNSRFMDANSKRLRLWLSIGLTVVTLAVYVQVYRHDFVDLDDGAYVFGNYHVSSGLSWQNSVWAFTAGHSGNWHPITWLSHMLDCQLFDLNPGPQHLVSVFIHVVNVLLLFLFLQNATGVLWRSASVAALFALHPLHVESVAWIAERKDVLSTFFGLCALQMYVSYARKPGMYRYLLSLGLFALGLMAKPMLVTLPFVMLLLDYWPLHRFVPAFHSPRQQAKEARQSRDHRLWDSVLPLFREKVPFFLLAAVSSIVTFGVQNRGGAVQSIDLVPFAIRVANAVRSYAAYLAKTLCPTDLSIFYRLQLTGYSNFLTVMTFLLLAGFTWSVIRVARRYPYLAVGWLWYLGTLVPVIGLVQVGEQARADRYTYVPLIGIFIAITWGLSEIAARRLSTGKALRVVMPALVAACSFVSWQQVQYWRNTITLASHAVAIDGDNYMARQMLGMGFAKSNKINDAISELSKAHQLRPANVSIMGNLGTLLYQVGEVKQAHDLFTRALKLKPDDPVALRNMGRICFAQGKFAEAADFYRQALRTAPDNYLVQRLLGDALTKLGRAQEAIDAYNTVLRIRPQDAEALVGLATVLAGQGKMADSASFAQRALQIDPKNAETHNLFGKVLLQQGQADQAIMHFTEALRIKPEYGEAHYNMGVALQTQGRILDATSHYRETIKLQPNYVDAYYNLAGVLENQGDTAGAIVNYQQVVRLRPDYAEAFNNLGVAYVHSGQIVKALESFTQALRVSPENADALRNREAILKSISPSKRMP